MPRFLEKRLQAKYGKDSPIPYKIMDAIGFMRGSKETAKGREAEVKHEKGVKGEMDKEKEVSLIKHKILTNDEHKKLHQLNSDITMGKPSHTKYSSNDDKVMSQEHKLDRAHVDSMDDGFTSKEAVLRNSIAANERHVQDHQEANKKAKKMLNDHLRGKLADRFVKGTTIKKD